MKPLEILTQLPRWIGAPADVLLASPAWALPCRLGDRQCILKTDAPRLEDTLDLSVKFDGEQHTLSIADSPIFPELHAVWSVRAEMPPEILLALVEKDCGPFLQLLENAVRRQLQISGLAGAPAGEEAVAARVCESDETLFQFAIDLSPAMRQTLGVLRNIDPTHQSVREETLPAEVQYASFALPEADVVDLAQGDAVLLPEVGSIPAVLIVDGRFRMAPEDVSLWSDDGLLRVLAAEPSSVDVGSLIDASAPAVPPPAEAAQLKLVRSGKTLANGRFGKVGDHPAMIIEALAAE